MKDKYLIIAETFYSIQGEGPTTGTPAVFLRLAGCNLLCKSEAWTCDTIDVWKHGKKTYFEDALSFDFVSHLKAGAHLVITGGEPLLHQEAIVDFLNWFRSAYIFTPYVEVETNGTIVPSQLMLIKVDQWNVSPKLANSGEPKLNRVNLIAINNLINASISSWFKFVINDQDDIVGMLREYGMIPANRIILMPAGDEMEPGFLRTRQRVVEICKQLHYRFSDRLHIMLWNKKTGV